MPGVLLICMPFSSTKWPSIGISLLKPRLIKDGFPCDIRYFNMDFAAMLGIGRYEEIAIYPRYLMGEWVFAQEFFGAQLPPGDEYRNYLDRVHAAHESNGISLDHLLNARAFVRPFLDRCMASVQWGHYDIVGFTTMFEQNLASLNLARRIKETFPDKTIVFGGANCDDEMGVELHRRFPFIDYVCTGEADYSFPDLVHRIRRAEAVDGIPGLVSRRDGESILNDGNPVCVNMDGLPYPDYTEYFAQLEQIKSSGAVCYELHMESSRGCWWGAKARCRFCGLNGRSLDFRGKSNARVLAELEHLVDTYVRKHDLSLISMVDNILDMKAFHGFLLDLKQRRLPVKLFFEAKANLKPQQVRLLHDAGVAWIQPGIESLSSHVLKLMGKGVSALQNVRLLRSCQQFGVYPTWNIIYNTPGETAADYDEIIALIYKLTHLTPPEGFIALCLQRFSTYYQNPAEYGIVHVRPEESYRYVYPFDEAGRRNLAYFFEFDYADGLPSGDRLPDLTAAIDYWRRCHERSEHLYTRPVADDCLLVEDSRSNARVSTLALEASHKDIYEYCDDIRNLRSICSFVRDKYSRWPVRTRDIRDFLEEMVFLNLMAAEGDRYLSLAVPRPVSSQYGAPECVPC
jgi:ribosomal peptide maturation radical SAM protein 1